MSDLYQIKIGGVTASYMADVADSLKDAAEGLTAAAQAAGLRIWITTEKPAQPEPEPFLRKEDLRALRATIDIDPGRYTRGIDSGFYQQTILEDDAKTIIAVLDAYKALREQLRRFEGQGDDGQQWAVRRALALGEDE